MIPFDLPLRLGMRGPAMNLPDLLLIQVVLQRLPDVATAVIGEKPRPIDDVDVLNSSDGDGPLHRSFDIRGRSGPTQFPGQDITREVIQHRREEIPAPLNNFEIGKIGLPQLVDPGRGIDKFISGTDHREGWTGDQIVNLQDPIDARLRDVVPEIVGDMAGQFSGRQLRKVQSLLHHLLPLHLRNLIPELLGTPIVVRQTIVTLLPILPVPLGEGAAPHSQLLQGASNRKLRVLHQPDYLHLLRLPVTHIPRDLYSKPLKLFFKTRFCKDISATNCLRCSFSWRSWTTSLALASRSVSPLRRFL